MDASGLLVFGLFGLFCASRIGSGSDWLAVVRFGVPYAIIGLIGLVPLGVVAVIIHFVVKYW